MHFCFFFLYYSRVGGEPTTWDPALYDPIELRNISLDLQIARFAATSFQGSKVPR